MMMILMTSVQTIRSCRGGGQGILFLTAAAATTVLWQNETWTFRRHSVHIDSLIPEELSLVDRIMGWAGASGSVLFWMNFSQVSPSLLSALLGFQPVNPRIFTYICSRSKENETLMLWRLPFAMVALLNIADGGWRHRAWCRERGFFSRCLLRFFSQSDRRQFRADRLWAQKSPKRALCKVCT